MKTKILILVLISASAYAASDLVREFTQRRRIVLTRQQGEVFKFLRLHKKDPKNIVELEMLNDRGKYALRFRNDDVCFGDTETQSLECYSAIGYRTFFEAGDLD